MNNNIIYSIWLQQCIGYASQKIKTIISRFGSSYNVYNSSDSSRRTSGLFTAKQLKNMRETSIESIQKIFDCCTDLGYNVISIEDDEFPRRLYEITNPPCVLYVSGKMPDFDNTLTIAIVGTRTATSEGIRNSFTFGRDLAYAGAIVVSGGALGVDGASHRGVLESDGITVCVLGCGINYHYLNENFQMRQLIAKRGAVISEYPPNTPPVGHHFPERNRIISGLSNGVLVIEAGAKSGSLITAQLALEQNRDVFSVPGSLINRKAHGSNELLRQGAITVTSYKDIIAEYAQMYELTIERDSEIASEEEVADVPIAGKNIKNQNKRNNKIKSETVKYIDNKGQDNTQDIRSAKRREPKCPDEASNEAHAVFEALSDTPLYVDQISEKLNMPPQAVMSALTELEIFDAAENVTGGRFVRKYQED